MSETTDTAGELESLAKALQYIDLNGMLPGVLCRAAAELRALWKRLPDTDGEFWVGENDGGVYRGPEDDQKYLNEQELAELLNLQAAELRLLRQDKDGWRKAFLTVSDALGRGRAAIEFALSVLRRVRSSGHAADQIDSAIAALDAARSDVNGEP